MQSISLNIMEYASQCERERRTEKPLTRGYVASVMASRRVMNMPIAERGHLHRAALKAFGAEYALIDYDRIEYKNKEYRYNFETGRFYWV